MKFIPNTISEKSIEVIESLIALYDRKMHEDMRKIIFKDIPDSTIEKFVQKAEDNKWNMNINGMRFDDNTTIRIAVDESILVILDTLEKLTKGILNRKGLLELILYEWINIENSNIPYDFIYEDYEFINTGHQHHPTMKINGDIWKDFKSICISRKITIYNGFNLAVCTFLERRQGQVIG